MLSVMAGLSVTSGQKIVMETAKQIAGGTLSDRQWKETLHLGFLAGTVAKEFSGELKSTASTLKGGEVSASPSELPDGELRLALDPNQLEIVIRPCDSVYDGRLANNGWLQELPQPITKLTWDNAAICSIGTARKLGLKHGELATFTTGDSKVTLPVFVVPGHTDCCFTVSFG